MKNVLKPLAKSVLIPLGLTAAALATDATIQRKTFGSGMTTLIISNEEMDNIMKMIKFPDKFGLLMKNISETIQNESKENKGGLLGMFLDTLGASLIGNLSISLKIGGGGEGVRGQKDTLTSFSPVTCTNVGSSPQNFLTLFLTHVLATLV